jgi:hypothetical protein
MGVIGAQPKNGKSTIATELAISLATGTPFCQHFPVRQVGRVLFVQRENSNERVVSDFHRILEARRLGYFETLDEIDHFHIGPDGEDVTWTEVVEYFVPTWQGTPVLEISSNADMDLSEKAWQEWLWEEVREHGYDYLFLDPYYQLVGANENDPAAIKPVLRYLTQLKNELGCAAIVTHHESDKTTGEHARRLLGSTYLHGWYEGALFPTRSGDSVFSLEVDALREMGVSSRHVLQGKGVGHWEYTEEAQGHVDASGRANTQRSKKEMRKSRLRYLLSEKPDWSNAEYGSDIGVGEDVIRRYRREIAADATVANSWSGQDAG